MSGFSPVDLLLPYQRKFYEDKSRFKVGLWSRETVEPATGGAPGALEIGIAHGTPADVDAFHASWLARGLPVLQPPTDMDFGRSCMVTDPDGHRIRVFAISM